MSKRVQMWDIHGVPSCSGGKVVALYDFNIMKVTKSPKPGYSDQGLKSSETSDSIILLRSSFWKTNSHSFGATFRPRNNRYAGLHGGDWLSTYRPCTESQKGRHRERVIPSFMSFISRNLLENWLWINIAFSYTFEKAISFWKGELFFFPFS